MRRAARHFSSRSVHAGPHSLARDLPMDALATDTHDIRRRHLTATDTSAPRKPEPLPSDFLVKMSLR